MESNDTCGKPPDWKPENLFHSALIINKFKQIPCPLKHLYVRPTYYTLS